MSFDGDLYPTAGATAVMTTTGDLVRYNAGARQRLGIGSTNQALSVVGGLPTWKTLTLADSVLTTQGDVLYESASGLARLGFGTSGDVLTTKGTGADPAWETPASGGATVTTQTTVPTNGSTTTSSSHVTIPNGTITLPTRTNGYCFISAIASLQPSSVPANCKLGIYFNGALQTTQVIRADVGASNEYGNQVTSTDSLDGGDIEAQWAISTGTLTLVANSINSSSFQTLEVS